MPELTRSQKDIQKAAREFAKGEFDKTLARESDKNKEIPTGIRTAAADLGFIGIQFEEEYLGGGMGLLEKTLLAEEFCRRDSSMGCALMLTASGAQGVSRFGTRGLKARFLPRVAKAKIWSAMAFMEEGESKSLSSDATTAVEKDGHWVIKGNKTLVLSGAENGIYAVLCRTGKSETREKSLSMILVESGTAGVVCDTAGETMGMRMTKLSNLGFDNVRVPLSNLIGKEGNGLAQARICMDENLILIASLALGTAQGALDRALDYVKQRVQFGVKIAQFQVTRHKLADMATKVQLARLITYRSASGFGKKSREEWLPAMAKLVSAGTAVEVADEAIQLLGGYGYMAEYDVERFFRDAKALELLQGAPNLHKNRIAAGTIGKIR